MVELNRVEAALDRIRPFLRREGGDLLLLGVVDCCVEVRVVGASPESVRALTGAVARVEAYLKDAVPGLRGVRFA